MLTEKPWRPDRVLRLVAGFYAAMILGIIVGAGYKGALAPSAANDVISFLLGILAFHGTTLVIVHLFLRQHRISWTEAFGFNEPRLGRTILLGVVVSVVVLPIALSLGSLTEQIVRLFSPAAEFKDQLPVEMLKQASSVYDLAMKAIAAIIFAPIIEEVVFRGVMYPAVKKYFSPQTALWAVAVIFALSHPFNVRALLPLVVIGIILSFLYETTRNLLAPMIAHALFNAANFVLFLYQR
ncbi:MAG TPA: CPBP family intramembrane glutamic endopeptidase [Verrucomicrobiae bacterium]